ncbi:MAG: response regulator transcription factor [Bacteroidales bacterium]|nr:response regulator transcription factor [Bacteroidales bacterium]
MKQIQNIRVLIVDDDAGAIESLKFLIHSYCPQFSIAGIAKNVEEGARAVIGLQPDIVFLDVEMPDGTGFDLLRMLKTRNFEVVFITAHNKYAISAIKHSALDYLLKPIDIKDFLDAVNRIQDRTGSGRMDYDVLLENLAHHAPRKLVVSNSKGYEYLPVESIVRLESDRSYARIFLDTGRVIMVSKCLNEYQQMLCPDTFFRIHNSHLINLNHVVMYVRTDGGYVEMSDESRIPVARSKKDIFINTMQQFVS